MPFERENSRENLEFYTPVIIDGEERLLVVNRGTTTVTLYQEEFSDFNHLRVLTGEGGKAVLIFLETPTLIREAEALVDYGFNLHVEQSPSDLVVDVWQNLQVAKLRNDLDKM